MNELISPKFQMKLIKDVNDKIWAEYKSYKEVALYLNKWHYVEQDWNNYSENFNVVSKSSGEIDLLLTLHNIDGTTLLKIAVDMGLDTPDFIPSVATFRNDIKSDFQTASATFEKAFKQVEIDPDIAIGLANSALESIVKEILKDERISSNCKPNDTLYDLISLILKEFKMFPNSDVPMEIKTLGSSLLATSKAIEGIRSNSTSFHGKTNDEYLVSDSIYTYLIVNSVTTIGLFLKKYYRDKFPKPVITPLPDEDELPF